MADNDTIPLRNWSLSRLLPSAASRKEVQQCEMERRATSVVTTRKMNDFDAFDINGDQIAIPSKDNEGCIELTELRKVESAHRLEQTKHFALE